MKHFVKFFVVTFFLFVCTQSFAEQKIVFMDLKHILNNSKAGKGAQDYLKNLVKNNNKKFADKEKKIRENEQNLLKEKSSLSKEDYKKKVDELRKMNIEHQKNRREAFEKIAKTRTNAREKLLKALDPILNDYMGENGISSVLDKKAVIVGNTDLDITNIVVEKLNKKLPSLNLK